MFAPATSHHGQPPSAVGAIPNADIHQLRDQFLADPTTTDLSSLRPVIARSWQRSLACNVTTSGAFLEASDPHVDEQLLLAAEPVLTELEGLCIDTGGSVVLTDSDGTLAVFRGEPLEVRRAERLFPIVGARMGEDLIGTNSDGTVIEEGEAVQVWGAEHFNDALQSSYCTSVPVRDPIRRSIRGVLGLMLPEDVASTTNPRSLLLLVHGAAAEITRRLAERLAAREQALMSEYMREVRKRGADAVIAMDDRTTIASRSALSMLDQSDFAVLAALARNSQPGDNATQRRLTVSGGREVSLQVRPMDYRDLGVNGAAVMRVFVPTAPGAHTAGRSPSSPPRTFDSFVGTSTRFRRALDAAAAAASRRLPAYVVGEQGTGKLRLAEAIAGQLADEVVKFDYLRSSGSARSAAEVDSVLARGAAAVLHRVDRATAAEKEEIADLLSLLDQPQLVVTTSAVTEDVLPIISALRGIEVTLPPLRERRDDILALAGDLMREHVRPDARLSPKLRDALVLADWPGNISQLRDLITSLSHVETGSEIRMSDLSAVHLRALSTARLTRLEEAELQQIRTVLAEAGGNRVQAASLLGLGRSTLYRKIEMYEGRGFDLELG
ncbi:sigma-54-dependent Fis family transcriptional regulator [Pseudolysinimonas yzui]|nr:helix-turn-helix domain-containing protein [Pseudolysinimonas yzui]